MDGVEVVGICVVLYWDNVGMIVVIEDFFWF